MDESDVGSTAESGDAKPKRKETEYLVLIEDVSDLWKIAEGITVLGRTQTEARSRAVTALNATDDYREQVLSAAGVRINVVPVRAWNPKRYGGSFKPVALD